MADASGDPAILTECDVLDHGSLNGFLAGKHYNRYPLTNIGILVIHLSDISMLCGDVYSIHILCTMGTLHRIYPFI